MARLISINAKFPKWFEKFKRMENDIFLFIAATLQTNRGMMFDDANAGRPTPWKDPVLREGMPLSQRGTLRKSWAPQMGRDKPGNGPGSIVRYAGGVVTIGTSLAKAPILNNGGVILPKKGKWLWIPLPRGSALSSNHPTDVAKELKASAGKRKKNQEWKWTKKPGQPIVVLGPGGKVWMLAKKVTIPPRPMNQWTVDDQKEVSEALKGKMERVLK